MAILTFALLLCIVVTSALLRLVVGLICRFLVVVWSVVLLMFVVFFCLFVLVRFVPRLFFPVYVTIFLFYDTSPTYLYTRSSNYDLSIYR